ncbi:hypothetical protein BSF44_35200 [Pseudomonas sp. ACN8]|jgi:hypothetical protein|uniref:hypothetical protein n=1 Tax=Pseudomonas sp. ACN8 TaxID=1920428 RepID=UPI000BB32BEC|nr:hypothetical protein [Pseudomonas sp. ACN8]PBJ21657.1 hypothetical protein BSF44_35200 [Pseudomonas sp. ACN8]
MNIRKQLLTNHFPEEVTEAILKTAEDLSADQFYTMYKFLMAEKASITEIYKRALEEDAQTAIKDGYDITTQILEAKYGKK